MRRKIKLAWIENETSRKASFKKRRAGLLKKVRELTTLCDVSACLIIYGPGDLYPAAVWPNEAEAGHLIWRFRHVPPLERSKKMVNQEEYLKERASKMAEQLRKMSHKNQERAASNIMRQVQQGRPLGELAAAELLGVACLLEDRMREIDRRVEFLRQPLSRADSPAGGGLVLPPPTEEEMAGRRDFSWDLYFTQLPDQDDPPELHRFIFDGGSPVGGFEGESEEIGRNGDSGLEEIGESMASGMTISSSSGGNNAKTRDYFPSLF